MLKKDIKYTIVSEENYTITNIGKYKQIQLKAPRNMLPTTKTITYFLGRKETMERK